jgi:hypothetical protein
MVSAAPPSAAGADNQCPAYLWISYGSKIRQKDGSITQRYHIRTSSPSGLAGDFCLDLKAYYRLGSRSAQARGYGLAPITCSKGDGTIGSFEINSKTNAHIAVFVVGTCGTMRWMAQASHPLFGHASPDAQSSPALVDLPTDFARLHLIHARHNFYMQTGSTYHFSYRGKNGITTAPAVYETRERVAELALRPDHGLAYTPPHDTRLDRSGHYATKEAVVWVTETAAGKCYATTYTLLLHRSINAHLKRLPGIVFFAAAAVATGILVNLRKRRVWYI